MNLTFNDSGFCKATIGREGGEIVILIKHRRFFGLIWTWSSWRLNREEATKMGLRLLDLT